MGTTDSHENRKANSLTAPGLDLSAAHIRHSLTEISSALAADGNIGDNVLSRSNAAMAAEFRAQLSEAILPPEPDIGYRLVPGLFSAFSDPGLTAACWQDADRYRTAAFDIALVIVASLLGEVFGWENQQQGRLVHNIMPTPGGAELQIGASSTVPLTWHTEDAFHPNRADFLLLACVRNPDHVGTGLSNIRQTSLSETDVAVLGQRKLMVCPDASYADHELNTLRPVGMSTVWRRSAGLCLRYDPAYTRMLTSDATFTDAYRRLGTRLDENATTTALRSGDLLIIDNDVMVHGRESFRARYDGTDRWIKRVLVRAPRQRPDGERLEHGFKQAQVHPGIC
jgi:L-asparagine oxygenase